MPTGRTAANDADLAIARWQRLQPGLCRCTVRDDLVVSDSTGCPRHRGNLGGRSLAKPAEEVGHDDGVALVGEASSDLLIEFIPARRIVHQHQAGIGPGTIWPGDVGQVRFTAAGRVGHATSNHTWRCIGPERVPHDFISCSGLAQAWAPY